MSKLDKVLSVAIAVALISLAGVLGYMLAADTTGERFTEFYVLGPGGNATNYPRELVLGEEADVTLGIVNHEGQEVRYTVKVTIDGEQAGMFHGIVLTDGEEVVQAASFIPTRIGGNQTVEFMLFKDDDIEPCGTLRLFVDVKEPH